MLPIRNPDEPIILGGKGSGKTHLMRFLSTSTQLAAQKIPHDLLRKGYVGVYLRCGGINPSRFEGKGQDPGLWKTIFHYYFDLALTELCLGVVRKILDEGHIDGEQEVSVVRGVIELFDRAPTPEPTSLNELCAWITRIRKAVDLEINNCSPRRPLNVEISATASSLVFGVPKVLVGSIQILADILVVYLIDELENLTEWQQLYVNSLVRENQPPCSIRIGAKLYGLKTLKTYSADEELKEGSEYERVVLDERFRQTVTDYTRFAVGLCVQRLRVAGVISPADSKNASDWFQDQFEAHETDALGEAETRFVHEARDGKRLWIERLRKHLAAASSSALISCGPGDVNKIVNTLSIPDHPVVERYNIHMLYQSWGAEQLVRVAEDIASHAASFVAGARETKYAEGFRSWKGDMVAHIYRDSQRPLLYAGLDNLIRLSHGLPRHLLVILKHIYDWSKFSGEEPFAGGKITTVSQQRGILDASKWFFQDARVAGPDGSMVQSAIGRLAELMRAIRYSDKPTEVSLCTFSLPLDDLKAETRALLSTAENYSLISGVDGGRPEKNSFRVSAKYQLNPLLAPRWDLPISRRGDLALSPSEVDALFANDRREFDLLLNEKTSPMMGPRFGLKKGDTATLPLFGRSQ